MPGWPTVDRAGDQELVEALRRAETAAPATLYDSYGERLYDYAFSLCGDGDVAADSVHDALVTAQGCVARLREPARLRPWLYALTRFQVRARMARRPGTPSGGMPLPELDEPADPELASLVREALGELSRGQREVLRLSLRHGLSPAEVGAVLGLTSRQSAARLGRGRDHLENAAAAVLLARNGRAHCPDLSALLDSWEGPLTPLLRRRLSGHIGGCEVCTEGRHRQVSAARLLDLAPVAYPPISLRRRVIDTCVRPELDQTRVLITDRGDSFDRSGFPVPADRRSRRRRSRRLAPLVLAGACLLAATGAVVMVNGSGTSGTTALRPVHSPAPTLSVEEESPTPEDEPSPTPSASPSRTPSPRVTPTAAAPRRSARRAPAPAVTRRRPVPGARLALSCPGAVDGVARIGLGARHAAVSWVATASQGLDVRPASGSIRAGGSVWVTVAVAEPDVSGSGRVTFTSNGGTATCALSWEGDEGPEPPTDGPTATEEPTGAPGPGVATTPGGAPVREPSPNSQ
ncbi:sigma-70 family RNA polymerase sigma factor [Nonomuraea sp. FMUSA5-5]|uniref:Sigma-70 family RNA polymerase sigma factor n=1 Tax=Nonomuraea composti TaxID=2720023 RepID=A0ABX1B6E1_9ACTN|nr:sigma-70 family RNA polymerase sigma factor [Nonomuraea sp. FMUSA5-5]